MFNHILSQFLNLLDNSHHHNDPSSSIWKSGPKNHVSLILQFVWIISLLIDSWVQFGKRNKSSNITCHLFTVVFLFYYLDGQSYFIPQNLEFIIWLYFSWITYYIIEKNTNIFKFLYDIAKQHNGPSH